MSAELDPQQQRQFALSIVEQLRAAGYEALWAGGCVRDQLMGFIPKDFDVATSARPEQVRQIFGERRTVAVGEAFGVICVLGSKPAGQVEVATFREDKGYADHRRPTAVEFTTAEADARRRDFTINGLFFDPIEGQVLDYVGGVADLEAHMVRAIGDPRARFGEDKLRLLRGVRFAAWFGFELERATREAIAEFAPQITLVSVERIAAEMKLMLTHPARAAAVASVFELGLLQEILPEVAGAAIDRPAVWSETLRVLELLERPSFALALAALLRALASPAEAYAICRRWKLSNADSRRVEWLVANQQALTDARRAPWSRLQRVLVEPGSDELIQLAEAVCQAKGEPIADLDYCREMRALPPDRLNPAPLITGDDLVAHGVAPGKLFQKLLEAARDAQLDGRIADRGQALALVDTIRGEE
jgi:poly(A) polymerase